MQEKCLLAIKKARQDHLDWVRKAKMLIEGLPVKEECIPINTSECAFGLWFDANIKKFMVIKSFTQVIEKIEETHHILHKEYEYIYAIYFSHAEQKDGFFKSLFKKEKTLSDDEISTAKEHYVILAEISKTLSKLLDKFSMQVRVLSQEDINKISL